MGKQSALGWFTYYVGPTYKKLCKTVRNKIPVVSGLSAKRKYNYRLMGFLDKGALLHAHNYVSIKLHLHCNIHLNQFSHNPITYVYIIM